MTIKPRSDKELLDFLRPDKSRAGSLYTQLARALTQAIHEGMLEDGDYLLPQRELVDALGVSRVTVRKAIASLVEDGLLVQRQGAGTIVTRGPKQSIQKNLAVLNSFTDDMTARGMQPSSSWIASITVEASPKEATALNLAPNSLVSRFARVRFASGTPIAYEVATVPAEVIPNAESVEGSLYTALEEQGARPSRATQTFAAQNADNTVAEFLKVVAGDAVLYIERTGFDQHNSVVEFTRSWYRGDIYDFVTELKLD